MCVIATRGNVPTSRGIFRICGPGRSPARKAVRWTQSPPCGDPAPDSIAFLISVEPHVSAADVKTKIEAATCAPEDNVHAALATMKQRRVRRPPVVGFGGTVLGVVSMNDIVLAAGADEPVRSDEVVDTLQAICGHHHPVPHVVAA